MKLWLDAQLPPFRSAISDCAMPATMTKDRDFIQLLSTEGPPPKVIWLRLGNSSNAALQAVLSTTLTKAIELLSESETWVEIRQSSHGN
jgi:predicted nuclease of predicted toxin-antitoxin system